MAHSQPARTAASWGRPTVYRRRRRRLLLGVVLVLLLAYLASRLLSDAGQLGMPTTGAVTDHGRTYMSAIGWPQQGQAALMLGDGRPEASPHEQPVPIASLAKVMTAYLTLERYPLSGAQGGFTVTVTAAQAQIEAQDRAVGQSVVAVAAGEQLTERQLLEALLIPSGNNIAPILAAQVAGSETSFVAEMNPEARALGMDHTAYTDPSGFDPSTVSTAADQLRVFQQAVRFPVFRQIVSMASVTLPVAGTLTNYNPLIAEGYAGKTGSDTAAGGCLAFFTPVTLGGRQLTAVGVVLGQGQSSDTRALLAAAGQAAQQLVDSIAPGTGVSAVAAPGAGGRPGADAGARTARRPHRTDVNANHYAGEHMSAKRWSPVALALIAIAALISGCGSSASAGTGAGGSGNTAASAQQAVKFAQCMRSNGVSNFPDPNGSGKLTIDAVANGSSVNTNSPAFKQAISACKDLEPAGFTGSKRSSQQQAAALNFAQCVRANGVPDFPDSLPNGPLVDTNRIPSANQPGGMSALHSAMQKCGAAAAAAGVQR